MRVINGKDKHEILAVDMNEEVIGKGYIHEFRASDLYEKDRMNYFIEAFSDCKGKSNEIRMLIVEKLIECAKEQRKKYPNSNARVYHCCFADDKKNIEFYSQFKDFNADEGMHLLTCDLSEYMNPIIEDIAYEVREDCLKTIEDVNQFIQEHSKVFVGHPYDVTTIKELQIKEGFKSIAIFDKQRIVANILLHIEEEDNIKYGCLEDIFVSREYRNKGLGEYLVLRGLDYFKKQGLIDSRLEVWSSNERAPRLYYKLGYKLMKVTEVSIGKMI